MYSLILTIQAAALQGQELAQEQADCVQTLAERYEQSGESASDVATAVRAVCRSFDPKPTGVNYMGQLTADERRQALADVRNHYRMSVILYVVNKRAFDAGADCVPFSINPSSKAQFLNSFAP